MADPANVPTGTPAFDWLHPEYQHVWAQRARRLVLLQDPDMLAVATARYREHPAEFIDHWGVTVDPRNAGTGIPVIMPFVLFPRQREYIEWVYDGWKGQEDGVLVKSRDCGASWLAMGFSVTMCLFWDNITIGFGSAKEEKVDRSGDPDCLFYKGRTFVQYLPTIFKRGWDVKRNSAHMRLSFPLSESSITGEAGDNIGRGGRKAIYFVDEFAHVERPKLVDASLSANTNCRVEMSSVQGTANVFAEHARGGRIRRFDFHYRDDPRKTLDWVKEKKAKTDPVVWAAEYECDFLASVEGIIIPQEWVQAAIGAMQKLGITPTGAKRGSYDVADRGIDKNCYASGHGAELQFIESWSGKGSDIFESVERVFRLADDRRDEGFNYDGDGMGAAVRGDARQVNEKRGAAKSAQKILRVEQFRGSGAVMDPERKVPGTDRKNIDFFENFKAQCWWHLRSLFLNTFRAVNGEAYDPASLISIAPGLPELTKTCAELSQPVWVWSKTGKMMIDKQPDDVASPNNADAVMMLYAYRRPPISIHPDVLELFNATGDNPDIRG